MVRVSRTEYFRSHGGGIDVGSLRSQEWYGGQDRDGYIHRAWMRRGLPVDAFDGEKPHIAIANTASDLTPCNLHLNEVASSVRDGILEAGGVPLNLPVVSLGETLVRPTAMLWRNMAAMAIEEMLRANPIDGVVLLGWLRQDDPVAADGGRLGRPAGDRGPRRSDAHRHVTGRPLGAAPTCRRLTARTSCRRPRRRDVHRSSRPSSGAPATAGDGYGLDDERGGRGRSA